MGKILTTVLLIELERLISGNSCLNLNCKALNGVFLRRLKTLRSRKAILVELKAEPWCKILFVCRGNLICTRYVCMFSFLYLLYMKLDIVVFST